jgi:hypothetical protein
MVKRKRTNSDLQVIIPKSKDRAIGTTLQTWSGRVKQHIKCESMQAFHCFFHFHIAGDEDLDI